MKLNYIFFVMDKFYLAVTDPRSHLCISGPEVAAMKLKQSCW